MDPQWEAWKDHFDKSADVHPVDWPDELGPLESIDELETFVFHMQQVKACDEEPAALTALCHELGYQDYWQYLRVNWTFLKYYGEEDSPTSLHELSFAEPRFSQALMSAMGLEQRFKAEQALRDHPELLAPIDGVTVNRWAEIHTHMAHKEDLALPELLATFELDVARWEAINQGWTERCQQDPDGGLAREFRIGQAMHSQGRYAESARAAAKAMRGDKEALVGKEPMPSGEYTQLTVDMQQWAMEGLDMAAKAQETLGISRGDLQDLALYWDTRRALCGQELIEHAEQASEAMQQLHEEQVDLDADLQLGAVFSGAAAQAQPGVAQGGAGTVLHCSQCGAPQQAPGQFTCGFCGGQIAQK